MRQPFRINICKLLLDGKTRNQQELFDELCHSYRGERQLRALDDHLQSLRAVGIICVEKEWVEECEGREVLVQSWGLTNCGRKRLAKVL